MQKVIVRKNKNLKNDNVLKAFWWDTDEVMQEVLEKEKIIIGSNLNGHVGKGRQESEGINGDYGVEEKNEVQEWIL